MRGLVLGFGKFEPVAQLQQALCASACRRSSVEDSVLAQEYIQAAFYLFQCLHPPITFVVQGQELRGAWH